MQNWIACLKQQRKIQKKNKKNNMNVFKSIFYHPNKIHSMITYVEFSAQNAATIFDNKMQLDFKIR